jgi:PST family polysaccharide transporter
MSLEQLRSRVDRVVRSTVAKNAVALYAVQAAGFVLPMVTLPYLARVLRPEGWGLVVFSQSFAAWLILLINYGFAFSATRAVAQQREDASAVARTVAGVQSAKLLLAGIGGAGSAVAAFAVPAFRAHPAYLLFAFAFAAGTGLSPLWYFQGIERLRGPAVLDIGARVLATAAVFVWVRGPGDAGMVLGFQAAAALASAGVGTAWMYRRTRFVPPRLAGAFGTLRQGLPLFIFCSAASIYTTANSFLLGLMAPPATVSFYGAGDKLVRAAVSLMYPLSQAMYPQINHQVARDRGRADRIVLTTIVPITAFGAAIALALAVLAPVLTQTLYGPGYGAAVTVLRVEAVIPVLIAIGTVVGIHWALPLGLDREYNRLVLCAGALHIGLCLVLVPRLGAPGMAWSSVVAETLVEGGLVWLFLRRAISSAPPALAAAGDAVMHVHPSSAEGPA